MSRRTAFRDVPRLEDPPLLTGRARFVDDIRPPGTQHAAFLRSPFAHARIGAVDATAARAAPGVRAVWTAADIAPHLAETRLRVALPSPAFRQTLDRPILAGDEVVHVGEAVAIVVATDRALAEDALALIEVDYDPLPAVADCTAALEAGSPTVHAAGPHNLVGEFTLGYGDLDSAFAAASVVVREHLAQHRGGGHSMECRGVLAIPDSVEDRLTVWSSTQTPHAARRHLCDLLGLAEDRIRVATPDVGGGFGPKLVFYPEEAAVTLAARRLGVPVKWIEDRREHFVATTQERDQVWDVEMALDAEGRILGVRGEMIHDHGAWTARGLNVPYGALSAMPLAYIVPAYGMRARIAATNKVPVTPVRGAGQPQGVFAMERLLDRAAARLGLDRAEIRRRNLVPADRMPYATPLRTRGGMQVVLDSGDYPGCMADALRRADWAGFAARQQAARAQGRHLGIGLANYVEGTGRGPFEHVSVRVEPSGRIFVASGAAPMGQGTRTMLAQLVADQLGGDMANVEVSAGDTATSPLGLGGFNSRQAVMAGTSAHVAALRVRERVLQVAATLLEVAEADLEIDGRAVRVTGTGLEVTLAEVARSAAGLPGFALPGGRPGIAAAEEVVIDAMSYANGSCVAEVEVDPGTGHVALTKITFVHDCGRALHPRIVHGQVLGGIAHGIGNALFEWMGFDEQAQPVTTTLAEYLLVTATEMPASIEIGHLETPTPLNPLGIKGVGESGVIPVAAAIASAVEDALAPFGVRIGSVPIAPHHVVAAVLGKVAMKFENTFEVPLPPDAAWDLLLDVQRIAPCFPGATLTELLDERSFKGRVAVKLGPVALSFAGTARFEELNEAARHAVVKAQGTDQKGRGGANAVASFVLVPVPGGTRVDIATELNLSGSVAQYGRGAGMIQAVAAELIGQFAAALREMIARELPAPASAGDPADRPTARAQAAPAPAAAPVAIGGLGLLWRAMLGWLRGAFRRG